MSFPLQQQRVACVDATGDGTFQPPVDFGSDHLRHDNATPIHTYIYAQHSSLSVYYKFPDLQRSGLFDRVRHHMLFISVLTPTHKCELSSKTGTYSYCFALSWYISVPALLLAFLAKFYSLKPAQ